MLSKITTIRLPQDLLRDLDRQARTERRTRSSLMLMMLTEGIRKRRGKTRAIERAEDAASGQTPPDVFG